MAVDALRSCYSVDVRFWKEQPERTSQITWSWADPSHGVIPYPTVFSSRVWDRFEGLPDLEIGEVTGTERWHNGLAPFRQFTTDLPCGSEEAWLEGLPKDDPAAEVWPNTRLPRCCHYQYGTGRFPLQLSGAAPVTPCCNGSYSAKRVVAYFVEAAPGPGPAEIAIEFSNTDTFCAEFPLGDFVYTSGNVLIDGYATTFRFICNLFGTFTFHLMQTNVGCVNVDTLIYNLFEIQSCVPFAAICNSAFIKYSETGVKEYICRALQISA